MAYRDDVIALGANHLWPCVGDVDDIIGTLNFVNSGGVFTGPQICEDAANSYVLNGTNDSALAASDPSVQDVLQDYCYSLWFQTDRIQQPPCRVFGDGGQTVNNSFFLGFGNSILCEADMDPDVVQVGSSTAIVAGRSYCLSLIVRDAGGGSSELEFFIDGVSQGTQTVADVSSAARGGFRIGGITGTTSYTIGGSPFQLVSPVEGRFAMISTFVGASVPTAQEVREELFEKGATPDATIASGTATAMQSAVDALSGTVRPNVPLCIRIEDVAGGGGGSPGPTISMTPAILIGVGIGYIEGFGGSIDGTLLPGFATGIIVQQDGSNEVAVSFAGDATAALAGLTAINIRNNSFALLTGPTFDGGQNTTSCTFASNPALFSGIPTDCFLEYGSGGGSDDLALNLDDITFDPNASIHVQWMGTGLLTITNSNGSDASIGSTPNGGTIQFVTNVPVTINVADNATKLPIEGARVRLVAGSDEIVNSLTDSNGQVTFSYPYIADQAISGRVRKGSSSPYYITAPVSGTITESGLTATVLMLRDE